MGDVAIAGVALLLGEAKGRETSRLAGDVAEAEFLAVEGGAGAGGSEVDDSRGTEQTLTCNQLSCPGRVWRRRTWRMFPAKSVP